MIVAIVGCSADYWNEESGLWALRRIEEVIRKDKPTLIVSGETEQPGGVHDWAISFANSVNVPTKMIPLAGKGAKALQEQGVLIAMEADKVVCIAARTHHALAQREGTRRRHGRGSGTMYYKNAHAPKIERGVCGLCPKEVVALNSHVINLGCWTMAYARQELKRQTQLIVVGR
jgi:hypothetical protein